MSNTYVWMKVGKLKKGGWEYGWLKSGEWGLKDGKMADEVWKIEEWWVREGNIEVADDEDIERLLQMNISR